MDPSMAMPPTPTNTNFINYQENPNGVNGIIVSFVLFGLATCAIVARIWSKKSKGQYFRLNDYAIFIAWFLSAVTVGLFVATVSWGLGEHLMLQVPLTNLTTFIKLEIALSMFWVTACTFVKISILDGYLQIFRGDWFIKAVYANMVFCVILWLSLLLETFLICRPFAKYWDPTIEGYCGSYTQAFLAQHSLFFISDVIIGILPIFVLVKLQMATSKKIWIGLIFGIGTLICVISLLRIVEVASISGLDITYNWSLLLDLVVFEPLLGILVACLPFIQPLINKVVESRIVRSSRKVLFSSRASGTNTSGTDKGSRKHNSTYGSRRKGYSEFEDSVSGVESDHIGLVQQGPGMKRYTENSSHYDKTDRTTITVATDIDVRSSPQRQHH